MLLPDTIVRVTPKRSSHNAESVPLVLAYHAVSSTWKSSLAISENLLRSQLLHLKQRGYVGLTLSRAEAARTSRTLPPRSVVVTFDDGYASTIRAAPILEEFDFPGTVFLVTDFVASGKPLAWEGITEWQRPDTVDELRPLTWEDAAFLADRGWEVGSHTVSHALLTRADDRRLNDELVLSRAAIEQQLGACTSLAYPYGQADERVAAAAGEAGYQVACMLTFAHIADEPMRRPRIGMSSRDHGVRLTAQVSGLARAARRSSAARVARAVHFRRTWLPND